MSKNCTGHVEAFLPILILVQVNEGLRELSARFPLIADGDIQLPKSLAVLAPPILMRGAANGDIKIRLELRRFVWRHTRLGNLNRGKTRPYCEVGNMSRFG